MLEIRNIAGGYGGADILGGVDFSVETGEMLGIIGPNGCGKTTLLRFITGVLRPRRGEVLIEGKSVLDFPRRELARISACVTQEAATDFSFDAREIVTMGRHPYISRFGWETRHDIETVDRAMEFTDVTHLADRPITDLSGGERQRVFIAMALAQEPRLLLLDEPTSHLDINHQLAIMDIVSRLHRESSVTVVMVSHDLNLASEYCDRLLMMNEGRVAHHGTPEEVLTPENIERIYGTRVHVERNPASGRPHIILISRSAEKRNEVMDRGL